MRLTLVLFAIGIFGTAISQTASKPSLAEPQWQKADQLFGQLELVTPIKKMIVVNGRWEQRLYVSSLKDAEVNLYRGAHSDRACCRNSEILAHTRSRRFGAFEFTGFQRGLYWLQVRRGSLNRAIPLLVTENFKAETCHAPEVGRSFVVDSNPPVVQVRIR